MKLQELIDKLNYIQDDGSLSYAEVDEAQFKAIKEFGEFHYKRGFKNAHIERLDLTNPELEYPEYLPLFDDCEKFGRKNGGR